MDWNVNIWSRWSLNLCVPATVAVKRSRSRRTPSRSVPWLENKRGFYSLSILSSTGLFAQLLLVTVTFDLARSPAAAPSPVGSLFFFFPDIVSFIAFVCFMNLSWPVQTFWKVWRVVLFLFMVQVPALPAAHGLREVRARGPVRRLAERERKREKM